MKTLSVGCAGAEWRRGEGFIRRTGTSVVVLGLLLLAPCGNATADRMERSISETLAQRTEESVSRNLSLVLQTRALQLRAFEVTFPHSSPTMRRMDRFYWGGCGGGRSFVMEPRLSKLPSDPTLVLGDGYLKCRAIRAAVFEPAVSVESYPEGYFGDYEYEGRLVSDRLEFSDEATLQQIFKLLVEAAREPDEETEYYEWAEFAGPELKLAEYRKEMGFHPEFLFEFVGDKLLRVEINLTAGSMLVQSDDKWDFYSVDRLSASALRALLTKRERS